MHFFNRLARGSAILTGVLLSLVIFSQVTPASAKITAPVIKNTRYSAELLGQSLPDGTTFLPGGSKTVTFTFKNKGRELWSASGPREVSAYTVDPNYHVSSLRGKTWLSSSRPARIVAKAASGETAKLTFTITAPQTPGIYREDFYLAAENTTWINDSHFYIVIKVVKNAAAVSAPAVPVVTSTVQAVLASSTPITSTPAVSALPTTETAATTTEIVGFWDDALPPERPLVAEPRVRINLFSSAEPIVWTSPFDYQMISGTSTLAVLPAGTRVSVYYKDGQYEARWPDQVLKTTFPLYFSPLDPGSYWELPEYTRTLSGRKSNFNVYRDTFIVAYNPKTSEVWGINELPLERYVAGVTEASDGVPTEYAKALQVAARSYAWQKLSAPGKPRPVFDMVATTADQLYLGYNGEINQPKIVAATTATAGQLVTYNGAPVVTPYFSRSNGTTRSWSAAWGGTDKPWLQPVEAIHDKGLTRLGHGVGMSARDAMLRAGNDGWAYREILAHYYIGTKIERIY